MLPSSGRATIFSIVLSQVLPLLQELFSEHAYRLLFCVHSFLAAKLALLDKGFIQKVLNRPTIARE